MITSKTNSSEDIQMAYQKAKRYKRKSSYIEVARDRFVSTSRIGNASSKHKPCHFYHVSSDRPRDKDGSLQKVEIGLKKIFRPRLVVSSESGIEDLKRLCVAPTLEQCLLAIVQDYHDKFYVWRSVSKISETDIPYAVYDAPLTQERWITKAKTFELVGVIERGPFSSSLYNYTRDKKPNFSVSVPVEERDWTSIDYTGMTYGIRGTLDFENLLLEKNVLRKYVTKHQSKIFFNQKECDIHDSQRRLRLRFNQG